MRELLIARKSIRISRSFVREHRVRGWIIKYWLRVSRSTGPCADTSRCGRRVTDGFSRTMVSGWAGGACRARVCPSAAPAQSHTTAGKLADVLRTRYAKLHAPPEAEVSRAVRAAMCAAAAGGTGLRKSVYPEGHGRRKLPTASDCAGPFLQYARRNTLRRREATSARATRRKTTWAEDANHKPRRTARDAHGGDRR